MHGRTVMVVDDDEDNAMVLEAALEMAGFEVAVARSLQDARSRLMAQPVEVLVTDFSLGDGDAIQLMSALGPKRPPVAILVTGYGGADDRERSRAAGFDAHLVKPVAFDQLERTIRERLEKLAQRTSSEPPPPM